ncbi:MAG: N-acetyl sugar amidotransferase [Candidatus Omnitrophica bacterium]|nr:N-acetyl sugar amidotransferase [Candidatus Omnitrophota bacterium]
MRYCQRCVMPNTRPGIVIEADGVCNACHGHDGKTDINWEARQSQLLEIIRDVKARAKGYDCIVPVSGGKDSTWQVVKCLEFGLKVLAVTWKTPGRTVIGQKNLDNLAALGVDHIDFTINPRVERVFTLKSLERTGSTAVPMHMALFAIPLRLAVAMDIPLVMWGESPHMEYGGDESDRQRNQLNHEWFQRHGILQNTTPDDWIDEDLTRADLEPYYLPSEEEFRSNNIQSIFLGYYLPWDPQTSLQVALEHGFSVREEGPKVGYYNYADIDCDFISVHHYFKWLKFGFTRLFDNLSIEIRNGRMPRAEALTILERMGPQVPEDDIVKLCAFLGISRERFTKIEEQFRNHDVWQKIDGRWAIPDFLIKNWRWAQ